MRRVLFLLFCIFLIPTILAEAATLDKNTQLLRAARDGVILDVQAALAKGADINTEESGYTALTYASWFGRTEIVKLLLDSGADVNVISYGGNTAILHAAGEGHTEIVKLLLNKGANVNNKTKSSGYTALIKACIKGDKEIVKLLLDKGADLQARTNHGFKALFVAARLGHTEVVKLLLERGAGVNEIDMKIALREAKQNNHKEVIKILEAAGAKE